MTKILYAIVLAVLLLGCQNTADRQDVETTSRQQEVYQVDQPLSFSDERETAAQIYENWNDMVNTWSVWRSEGTNHIEDWCPSVGFGLPYDTSIINSLKPFHRSVIEQIESNGLFSSNNTKVAWILCVLPNGEVAPVYIEATVTVYPWPIRVEGNKVIHLYEEGSSVVLDISR